MPAPSGPVSAGRAVLAANHSPTGEEKLHLSAPGRLGGEVHGTVLEGEIPKSKMKLLEAWMEIYKEDLEANWTLLSNGEQFFRIEPLK